jgi:diaminopimelate decarboxylase
VKWRTQKLLEISLKIFKEAPKFLDFGGGFFGSDFSAAIQNNISFDEYAKTIVGLVKAAYPDSSMQPVIILEPGTALVANTMSFWTKVVSTKKVAGKSIAVVDGSIHEMNPNGRKHRSPTFHTSSAGRVITKLDSWQVVGYTCIEDDYLSKDYVSNISKGDFLGYSHVGSYNIVMKPSFIRPASAVLELGENSEVLNVIREKQTISEVFSGFQYWV